MYKFITIVLFFVSIEGKAQSKKTIQILSNSRLLENTVFVTKDSNELEQLFSERMTFVFADGTVEKREVAIKRISSNKSKYTFDLSRCSAYSISEVNDSIVMERKLVMTETNDNGINSEISKLIKLFWIKEKGRYKLLSWEESSIN